MSHFISIAKIDLGDTTLLVTSDASVVMLKSQEDMQEMHFNVPSLGISVPARSVDMLGSSASSGSASIGISTEDFDVIGYIASGGSVLHKQVEIRLVYEDSFYEDSYLAYRGIISSFGVDPESGRVDFDIGPDFISVDKSFPATTVGDEGRFPGSPDGTKSRAIPVIYGEVRKVPVPIVAYVQRGSKVRLAVASHHIYGSNEKPGYLQIGTTPKGDLVEYYEVKTGNDSLGGFYSYIDVPVEHWDDSIYIVNTWGKTSSNGRAISRLGDTLQDLWVSYAGGSSQSFDAARASRSALFLNSIRVGLAITESVSGQSVIDIVAGRFNSLPVRLCYDRGLFCWEAVSWPAVGSGSRSFTYGIDSSQRSPLSITQINEIRNRFRFKMGFDAKFNETTETRIVDRSNSSILRQSASMFGETSIHEVDLSDATDKLGAGIAIDSIVKSKSGPRITVSYSGCAPSFLDENLGEPWSITDEESGLRSASFVLVSVQPDVDSGTVSLTFVSTEDVNTTLRRSKAAAEIVVSSAPAQPSGGGDGGGGSLSQARKYGVFLGRTGASTWNAANYEYLKDAPLIAFEDKNTISYDGTYAGFNCVVQNDFNWGASSLSGGSSYPRYRYFPLELTNATVVHGDISKVIPNQRVMGLNADGSNYLGATVSKAQVTGYMRFNYSVKALVMYNQFSHNDTNKNGIGWITLNAVNRMGMNTDAAGIPKSTFNSNNWFDYGTNYVAYKHIATVAGGITKQSAFANASASLSAGIKTLDAPSHDAYIDSDLLWSANAVILYGDFQNFSDEDMYMMDFNGITIPELQQDKTSGTSIKINATSNSWSTYQPWSPGDTYYDTHYASSAYFTSMIVGFVTEKNLQDLGISVP